MSEQSITEGLSIVIPVYNEVNVVTSVLEDVIALTDQVNHPVEVIVIDDGSSDGTSEALKRFAEKIRVFHHLENRGYGSALKTGIRKAVYDYIAITDADGTYPIKDLPKLIKEMKNHDMVVGSRTGSEVYVPPERRPAKWLLNKLANYLVEVKIPDLNSGFRIFRKGVALNYLHILPNRFSFTTTITLAMISDGYSVHYEPIDYYRRSGDSKVKPGDAVSFLMLIIRTITYFNPLRIFLPVSAVLFFLGVCRFCYDVFWLYNLTDSTTILFLFALQIGLIGIMADLIVKRSGP